MAARSVHEPSFPESTGEFPTPGPRSHGQADGPAGWKAQRADLGLSEDASGESDGHRSTIAAEAKVIAPPEENKPAVKSRAETK